MNYLVTFAVVGNKASRFDLVTLMRALSHRNLKESIAIIDVGVMAKNSGGLETAIDWFWSVGARLNLKPGVDYRIVVQPGYEPPHQPYEMP